MKRGVFIRNIALGSLSLGMFSPGAFMLPAIAQTSPARLWLRQLGAAFATKRRSRAVFAADSFDQACHTTLTDLAQHGYRPKNETLYFFGKDETWCFLPVLAKQAMPNGLDLLLPVFHRDGNGKWHKVKTFTAFQVEALSQASHSLGAHTPSELVDLLMPALHGGHDKSGNGYYSKSGMVSIKTTNLEGKIQNNCEIRTHSGDIVLRETRAGLGLQHV